MNSIHSSFDAFPLKSIPGRGYVTYPKSHREPGAEAGKEHRFPRTPLRSNGPGSGKMTITHELAEPPTASSSFSLDQHSKDIVIRCLGLLSIVRHTNISLR